MHLSLLREYLDMEFQAIRTTLPFDYDLERIIDDYVMMAMFIGNDFVPHLPNLHINEGAMGAIFSAYKRILPQLGGYINDGGVIHFDRAEKLIRELEPIEFLAFDQETEDENYMRAKRNGKIRKQGKGEEALPALTTLTEPQAALLEMIDEFVQSDGATTYLHLSSDLPARDREFVRYVAKLLGIQCTSVLDDVEDENDEDGEWQTVSPRRVEDSDMEEEEEEGNGQLVKMVEELVQTKHLRLKWTKKKSKEEREEVIQRLKELEVLSLDELAVEVDDARKKAHIDWKRKYYKVSKQLYVYIVY
jgi:5'-3' exoribonuclease 1